MKRKTRQRRTLEDIFSRIDRPLSVDEILNYGREVVHSLNRATVYRNLKLMVDEGWLSRVTHPAGMLYERADKEHHHHFHCRACNRAFELPGCALREDNIAPEGFIVEEHEVFLYGVCPSCTS